MTGVWTACLVLAGALAVAWPAAGAGLARRSRSLRRPRLTMPAHGRARLVPAAILAATVTALLTGGPVAAAVVAAYGTVAARAAVRRAAHRRAADARTASLDNLAALAADLRAGLPPAAADARAASSSVDAGVATPSPGSGRRVAPADRLARLTASVWRLAERTGAPAADLLERIEADARAADRAAVIATAQAAGARATAFLLAALPLGGIGIGVLIGADPVDVLLHTPLGAACALVALLLQCCGLFWADRLASGAAR